MQKEYTVGAWAWEWFRRGAGRWSPSTEGGYRNLIERNIVPGIGSMKLKASGASICSCAVSWNRL